MRTDNEPDRLTRCKQATTTKLACVKLQWDKKNHKRIQILSSRCKVKHVGFYQHRETVSDGRSFRGSKSSQFTKVFYSNPNCNAQHKDLPHRADDPRNGRHRLVALVVEAQMVAGQNELLWYLLHERASYACVIHLWSKLTSSNTAAKCYRHRCGGDVDSKEDCNKKDEHPSRSLTHDI